MHIRAFTGSHRERIINDFSLFYPIGPGITSFTWRGKMKRLRVLSAHKHMGLTKLVFCRKGQIKHV
jgi:hypothetical protein